MVNQSLPKTLLGQVLRTNDTVGLLEYFLFSTETLLINETKRNGDETILLLGRGFTVSSGSNLTVSPPSTVVVIPGHLPQTVVDFTDQTQVDCMSWLSIKSLMKMSIVDNYFCLLCYIVSWFRLVGLFISVLQVFSSYIREVFSTNRFLNCKIRLHTPLSRRTYIVDNIHHYPSLDPRVILK